MHSIPYKQIQTLFLDAGNTMISINFEWVCTELKKLGLSCSSGALRRAEAAARPLISDHLKEAAKMTREQIYTRYTSDILAHLPSAVIMKNQIPHLTKKIVPILLDEDTARRLWSSVMPGVREALKQFKAQGLQLVVVSNANGTVEEELARLQLRSYFDAVIDSHIVGVEKPDPEIFRIALKRSGAIPEKTIHIGDLYDVDVLGARSAGIHAILLDPYSDWQDVDCERSPNLLALSEKFPTIHEH